VVDLDLSGTGDLSGLVRGGPDDGPLSGVTVELVEPHGDVVRTTASDEEGRFRFTGVEEGRWSVVAHLPRHRRGAVDVEVEVAEEVTCEVALEPVGVLGGSVTDAGRFPLPHTRVTLLDPAGSVVATTETDAAGRYLFGDLEPGDYVVVAHPAQSCALVTAVGAGVDTAADLTVDEAATRTSILV
jgi:hypothetical protein